MNYKSVEEIISLLTAFEDRTLAKAEWTHAAHLTVGLAYCYRFTTFERAKYRMGDGIHWLNVAHGTPNSETSGYHETLTIFWLRLVWNFLEKRGRSGDLAVLANELIAAFSDPKLSLKFYSRELLFSPEARANYVKPDLRRFSPDESQITLPRIHKNKLDSLQTFFFECNCPCGWLHGF